MIELNKRIDDFVILGNFINQFITGEHADLDNLNTKFYSQFAQKIENTQWANPWFTPEYIKLSLKGISLFLEKQKLQKWTANYNFNGVGEKTIALILAGNIPLVGFHDVLSVLISGHKVLAKLSSKDDQLIKLFRDVLIEINPEWERRFVITNQFLKGFDAVIATGSNNSARYFDYYFGKYPHIIRNNRNSVGILNGTETMEQLSALADDVFLYFGLGCRNVSKLFVPENYDFQPLFKAFEKYRHYINHHKYANNYEYRRAIFNMNQEPHFDTDFVLLKENQSIASPVGVLYYEFYQNIDSLKARLAFEQDKIQCIVAQNAGIENSVPFGKAQFPQVWDYADNVDTLKFLTELK